MFTLNPYTGNPSLSVNCDVRPKLADFFEWQSDEDFRQEILITALERRRLNCTNKIFYVGVATLHPTQYTLNTQVNDGEITSIEFNLPIRYIYLFDVLVVKSSKMKS
jgi:hypothetical protein